MEFNQFYRLRVQYRKLNEAISLFSDKDKLSDFLDELRANVNPPYPYTEEAIQTFVSVWEFQHKKRVQKYENTGIVIPHSIKEVESEKEETNYNDVMCQILATSILGMIRLYGEETEKIQNIKDEVQMIAKNMLLANAEERSKQKNESKETYKKLCVLQLKAIAILAIKKETE